MRILFVTGIFPPDRGGPASYVPKVAAALVRRGHRVEVICLSNIVRRADADHSFFVRRIRRGQFWPLRVVATTFAIWRAARLHDLLYVNGLGFESAIAAILAGRPTVHKIVGDYAWERAVGRGWFTGTINQYQRSAKNWRLRFTDFIRTFPLRLAHEIIVPSQYLRRTVHGWDIPAEKIRVVSNAVAARTRSDSASLPSWPGRTLMTVCRLVPWKGVDGLIRLLPELPETRLVIAGDGHSRDQLQALTHSTGVESRVLFLGDVPQDAVTAYLTQADAFVLNSSYEGLPHVVLEAFAARTPVIATAAGGTGEIVQNNINGLLVPVGDSAALKSAIEQLWREPELGRRLANEAAERSLAHFAFDAMVASTEEILRAVVPGNQRAEHGSNGSSLVKDHSVLSFGYTRTLWDGGNAEDVQRMKGYAEQLASYVVVTNSYKRHRLQPLRLAPNFEAIPTNAFTPADSFLRMLAIGRAILRTRAISVLQAQDPILCGLAAVLLGKIFHRPAVVCVFGPNVYDSNWLTSDLLHRPLAPIGRWVLRQCQCIQVDGAMTARSLIEAGLPREKIEIKPMVPANLERFLEIQRAPVPAKIPRLLFVGRLCSQKNLPLLLDVVKTLRDSTQAAFELRLVGEGKSESELRAMVERAKLSGCVAFRGSVPREKIAEEFATADIFVLTSDYEGYPRVLMEAAAAALPIVTTAVSGSDEAVVNGETGYVVPVRARDTLVEKLSSLLEQPERRIEMGLRGRRHIRERLDPSMNAPRQVAIWRKAAQPCTPAIAAEQEQYLLLFNLVTDSRDPILGFTTQWIRELAARVSSVDVITMRAGVIDVPPNVRVHSVGKEHGYSEPRRVLEFYRHLFRILRAQRINGCFSHMMPTFSALAGPILRARRIPLVTWYAHPNLTFPVRVAHFFSNRMVTSLPHAYPYRKDKLSVIGQGIDTALFAPSPTAVTSDDLVLCAGRISRVKNHPTLLRAAAFLRIPFRLVILGATAGADDEIYTRELKKLASELGLENSVTFASPVPRGELPEHYRRCAVHVNLTPAGFGDKVAWEAMSCGRPCLVANDDFRETLGRYEKELLFRGGDPTDLAGKLRSLLNRTSAQRNEIGLYLREQVERLHSLPRLATRVLDELQPLRPNRAPAFPQPVTPEEECLC